jgi:hypothetical protein
MVKTVEKETLDFKIILKTIGNALKSLVQKIIDNQVLISITIETIFSLFNIDKAKIQILVSDVAMQSISILFIALSLTSVVSNVIKLDTEHEHVHQGGIKDTDDLNLTLEKIGIIVLLRFQLHF